MYTIHVLYMYVYVKLESSYESKYSRRKFSQKNTNESNIFQLHFI